MKRFWEIFCIGEHTEFVLYKSEFDNILNVILKQKTKNKMKNGKKRNDEQWNEMKTMKHDNVNCY